MKRRLPAILLCLVVLGPLWPEVRFADPDLSADNLLLFEVRSVSPPWGAHDTLFMADLETRDLTQLTHFPERLNYLAAKKVLQLQNRFGVFYSDETLGNFQPAPQFPSFIRNNSRLSALMSGSAKRTSGHSGPRPTRQRRIASRCRFKLELPLR